MSTRVCELCEHDSNTAAFLQGAVVTLNVVFLTWMLNFVFRWWKDPLVRELVDQNADLTEKCELLEQQIAEYETIEEVSDDDEEVTKTPE